MATQVDVNKIVSYYIGTGDCKDMSQLRDQSVHCVTTSPPYWGLRDNSLCTCVQPTKKQDGTGNPTYTGFNARWKGEAPPPPVKRKPDPDCPLCYGTGHVIAVARWEGGDPACDHLSSRPSLNSGLRNDGREHQGLYEGEKATVLGKPFKHACKKCGATRVDAQLGMEETVEEYVQHIVERFQEVKRVLRDDGTLWLNLGDCYVSSTKGENHNGQGNSTMGFRADGSYSFGPSGSPYLNAVAERHPRGYPVKMDLKPKNLVGVPWLVAFALQADGWILRSAIIWAKPNCMPESCTDRPTNSHEYIFLLVKSDSPQYWTHPELGATRKHPEPDYLYTNQLTGDRTKEVPQDWHAATFNDKDEIHSRGQAGEKKLWKRRNLWEGVDYFYDAAAIREPIAGSARERDKYTRVTKGKDGPYAVHHDHETLSNPAGRNKRSVWWISPQPYEGAHFSTFPEAIPEICIKAGTSAKGVCPECGAPWVRIEIRATEDEFGAVEFSEERSTPQGTHKKKGGQYQKFLEAHPPKTTGWSPSCECGPDPDAIAQWRKACGADKKGEYHGQATKDYGGAGVQNPSAVKTRILAGMGAKQTVGWAASCDHVRDPIPAIVLDPFGGAGTTLYEALKLNRRGIAWELNPANVQLIEDRIKPFKNQTRIENFFKRTPNSDEDGTSPRRGVAPTTGEHKIQVK